MKNKNIAIQEFYANAEFTVGKIYHAERVRGANKLLKLGVDCGDQDRVIVTNLGEYFSPEKLINVHTVFITNFPNVMIKGIESEGMLFYGTNTQGRPFVINLGSHIEPGSKVG